MAYSSFQMTLSEEEFTCPLCLAVLEEPKSLPGCAHNFCRSCLHEMLVRNNPNSIPCPVCREPSRVPCNGADGFPTNTLIVRLMDNIPGRKEKQELLKAVASCKGEIERNKKLHEDIQRQCSVIERNKELAEELKTQVSEYAKESIESIKQCEEKLCREIDKSLNKKYGVSSQKKLEKNEKTVQTFLEDSLNCVYSVEDILSKDNLTEILDMKTLMVEQLDEYSQFSRITGVASKEIRAFDLEFEKNGTARSDILGVVVDKRASACGRDSGSSRVESESFSSQSSNAEAGEEGIENLFASSSSSYQADYDSYTAITNDRVVASVSLPFEPFRIAVSPHSGDVAVLWKENNKVYLFNAGGTHFNTINIKYGNLFDVGFSIDDHVVVVNRASNRLLFYTKDSHFMAKEYEIPRSDLKYTYLSVDEDGRLIVTSAAVTNDDDDGDDDGDDDNDDDEVVQCIIVYDADDTNHKKMFGRKCLSDPVSRAVFHNGKYYIADASKISNSFHIRIFSSQGQLVYSIESAKDPHDFVSLSKDPDVIRLLVANGRNRIVSFDSSGTLNSSLLQYPHNFNIRQLEVLPKSFFSAHCVGMLQVEIYRDQKIFNIVHYH